MSVALYHLGGRIICNQSGYASIMRALQAQEVGS